MPSGGTQDCEEWPIPVQLRRFDGRNDLARANVLFKGSQVLSVPFKASQTFFRSFSTLPEPSFRQAGSSFSSFKAN